MNIRLIMLSFICLYSHAMEPTKPLPPLHQAARNGNIELVRELTNPTTVNSPDEVYGATPLHHATAGGSLEVAQFLLQHGANVNAQYTMAAIGTTPLILAADEGHAAVVELLLKAGAHIEAKDDNGDTPLIMAATSGHRDIVELLLKAGANIEAKDADSTTLLILAISNNERDIVELLLKAGAHIEAADDSNATPLSWAATSGDRDVVELLLEAGAHIEARDNNGDTPLISAARSGDSDIVELLLTAGANITAKNNVGYTSLHRAAEENNLPVVKLLVMSGADRSARTNPPLEQTAAELTTSDTIRTYLGNASQTISASHALLQIAASNRGFAKKYLELNADLDVALPPFFNTPLHWAIQNGNRGMAQLCITHIIKQKKAAAQALSAPPAAAAPVPATESDHINPIDATNIDGNTPLHLALIQNNTLAIIMLLGAGADPYIKNHAGKSQVQLAAETGRLPIFMVAASRSIQEKQRFIAGLAPAANIGQQTTTEQPAAEAPATKKICTPEHGQTAITRELDESEHDHVHKEKQ